MRIIFDSVLLLLTKNYQNWSMLVEATACQSWRVFYRSTRMHSADYAVAKCLSVCLSVWHTPVSSLNGYTYPQSFFIVG